MRQLSLPFVEVGWRARGEAWFLVWGAESGPGISVSSKTKTGKFGRASSMLVFWWPTPGFEISDTLVESVGVLTAISPRFGFSETVGSRIVA